MSFKIVDMAAFQDYEMDDSPRLFETGAEAAIASKNLEIIFKKKYSVRPYTPPSDDWKDRENARLEDGTYTKVLPSLQQYCAPDHFVHVSKEKPDMIAYMQNAFKGSKDIQSRSTITGYLEKFAKEVTPDMAADLQDEHDAAFAFVELKWARTPEEIEKVYTNFDPDTPGVRDSCMRGSGCIIRKEDTGEWQGQVHPVHAYGNSDLELAYIENHDGFVIARALVYPKKMVYSRCYGSGDSTNKLHRFLKKKGYSKSQGYYGVPDGEKEDKTKTLSGARIRAIRWKDTYNYKYNDYASRPETWFVVPYIDEASDLTLMKDEDGKEYFLMGTHRDIPNWGYLRAQSTSGVSSMTIVEPPKPKVVKPKVVKPIVAPGAGGGTNTTTTIPLRPAPLPFSTITLGDMVRRELANRSVDTEPDFSIRDNDWVNIDTSLANAAPASSLYFTERYINITDEEFAAAQETSAINEAMREAARTYDYEEDNRVYLNRTARR